MRQKAPVFGKRLAPHALRFADLISIALNDSVGGPRPLCLQSMPSCPSCLIAGKPSDLPLYCARFLRPG